MTCSLTCCSAAATFSSLSILLELFEVIFSSKNCIGLKKNTEPHEGNLYCFSSQMVKKKQTNCTFMCIFKNLTVESGRLRVNVLEREEQSTGG